MPSWIQFIFLAAAAFAASDILRRFLAPQLNGLVITFGAYLVAAFSALLWLILATRDTSLSLLGQASRLWPYLVANGIVLALGVVAQLKAFASEAPLSLAVPVLVAGLVIFSSTAGLFIFREPFTLKWLIGLALALLGIILIVSR